MPTAASIWLSAADRFTHILMGRKSGEYQLVFSNYSPFATEICNHTITNKDILNEDKSVWQYTELYSAEKRTLFVASWLQAM